MGWDARRHVEDLRTELDDLQEDLKTEKDHSKFLEILLEIVYGDGWNSLTIAEAREWKARQK